MMLALTASLALLLLIAPKSATATDSEYEATITSVAGAGYDTHYHEKVGVVLVAAPEFQSGDKTICELVQTVVSTVSKR